MDKPSNKIFQKIRNELKELNDWSKIFWESKKGRLSLKFIQQGFEDKGHGHITTIISNVEELLEKYIENVCDPNNIFDLINYLKPNINLFYIITHLHDIGMNFPGIFKALTDYVADGADSVLHISEIIHDYHHYCSFIMLLEIVNVNIDNTKISNSKFSAYLEDLPSKEKKETEEKLKDLKKILRNLFQQKYEDKFRFKDENDFFVLLAILCLLHKEINSDYIRSILRKFKDFPTTIRLFDKWWSFYNKAEEWTKNLQGRLPKRRKRENDQSINDIFKENESVILEHNEEILDILLVEALLQYGDKTDVTIARLTRGPIDGKLPLEIFRDDVQYDNKDGFICTDMAKKIISPFARFRACRFISVISISIDSSKDNKKDTDKEIFVTFNYIRFNNDNDIFPIIRFYNEKDFYDLGFLQIIKTHLPMITKFYLDKFIKDLIIERISYYEDGFIEYPFIEMKNPFIKIMFKKDEYQIDDIIKDEVKIKEIILKMGINTYELTDYEKFLIELMNNTNSLEGLRILKDSIMEENIESIIQNDRFPYTPHNKKAILKYSDSILNTNARNNKVFYNIDDMTVPSSFGVLAILNLFQEEE